MTFLGGSDGFSSSSSMTSDWGRGLTIAIGLTSFFSIKALNGLLIAADDSKVSDEAIGANSEAELLTIFDSTSCITSSSHVFHESWTHEFFHETYLSFVRGLESSFFCYNKQLLLSFGSQ